MQVFEQLDQKLYLVNYMILLVLMPDSDVTLLEVYVQ